MRTLALTLFLIAAGTSSLSADSLYYSYYNGNRYEFQITQKQFEAAPTWNPEKEANPPLSAAKALEKANQFIRTIPPPKDCEWRLRGIELSSPPQWLWRARYELRNLGVSTGAWPEMDCWILFDGTVIQPKIEPHDETSR